MPFSSFGLNQALLRSVQEMSYTQTTPVQAKAIGPAMEGHDLLVSAATGSGKTAAFLLPTLHRLLANPRKPTPGCGPRVLVLSPTRELAAQIHEQFLKLTNHTSLRGAPIYGGVSMRPQEQAFRFGFEVLISTPGRLLDHLSRPYATLKNVEILILDEADRMLDMGFLPDIKRILQVLPTKRQTLFFSATMPPEIRQLTTQMLQNPQRIEIERTAGPAVSIAQSIYPVPSHLKSALLLEMLKAENEAKMTSVICFTRTKHRANRLSDYLQRHGIQSAAIHGNRSQAQRMSALAGFKAGTHRVLVATDIAARGIDVEGVSHVVNFDCPHLPEDYIHRVGRTGRAQATGDAFTFVSPDEEFDLKKIERAINKKLDRVKLENFDYKQNAQEKLEVPLAERIAKIREQKSLARARQMSKGQQRQPRDQYQPRQPQQNFSHGEPMNQEPQFDQRHDRQRHAPRTGTAPHFGDHHNRQTGQGEMAPRREFGANKPTAGELHRQSGNNPGRRKAHLPGHGPARGNAFGGGRKGGRPQGGKGRVNRGR